MYTRVLVLNNANTHNSLGVRRMNQIAEESLKLAKGNPEKDDVVFHFVCVGRKAEDKSEEYDKKKSDQELELFRMRMNELFKRGTNANRTGKQTADKVSKAAKLFKITRDTTNEEAFELACDTFDRNDRISYTHIVLVANEESREDEKRFICEVLLQKPMDEVFDGSKNIVVECVNPYYENEMMKSDNLRDEETPTEYDF